MEEPTISGSFSNLFRALTRKSNLLKVLPVLVLAGIGLRRIIRHFSSRRIRTEDEKSWRDHVDMNQVQACLLSTEHLQELGRIEKRTLFVKDVLQFFGGNTFAVEQLLEAAKKTTKDDPVVTKFLDKDDKWQVLNICTNQISSLFAPYHIFFNEARRCASYYRSAWYCFTLTCTRNEASGRYFITPFRPVPGKDDVGALRLRVVMVNEQELRDVASGAIQPPAWGFFNERHRERWAVLKAFSELFESQLRKVSGSTDLSLGWGANLCGRIGAKRASNPNQQAMEAMSFGAQQDVAPDDNCFLRIHIPFPAQHSNVAAEPLETRSKDVVLFE